MWMASPSDTETVLATSLPVVLRSAIVVVNAEEAPLSIRVNLRFFFPTPGAADNFTYRLRMVPEHGRYRSVKPLAGPYIVPERAKFENPLPS
jgi:hypothetical protein